MVIKSGDINTSNIIVRICFKNNIEQDYNNSNNISLNIEKDKETKEVISENNFVSYTAKDVDQNFLFSNQNRLNDNYELYIQEEDKDKKKIYIPLATSSYFFDFQDNELLTEDSVDDDPLTNDIDESRSTISMQTKEDYFRQSFINDYITLKPNDNDSRVYDRPAAKRNLVVKVRFSDVNEAPSTIMLKSAENSYNAIYGNDISSIRHNTLRDFSCFDRNGSKIIPTVRKDTILDYIQTQDSEINNDKTYFIFSEDSNEYVEVDNPNKENLNTYYEINNELEIVPEHTNTRKYEWKINGTLPNGVTIPAILYSQYIYPWNVEDNTVLGYKNGSLILYENNINKNIDDLIIYDNGDIVSIDESTIANISKSIKLTDLPSITTRELNTSYEIITDPYLLNDERKFDDKKGDKSGIFTYNKNDTSLRTDIYEPWHIIERDNETKKLTNIQFTYKEKKDDNTNNITNSNAVKNEKLRIAIDKINDYSIATIDQQYLDNFKILESNLYTMFESGDRKIEKKMVKTTIDLSNETEKFIYDLSDYQENGIVFIKFNTKGKSNEWIALSETINESCPYFFQYRDLSNQTYALIFIYKQNSKCVLHTSLEISSIDIIDGGIYETSQQS